MEQEEKKFLGIDGQATIYFGGHIATKPIAALFKSGAVFGTLLLGELEEEHLIGDTDIDDLEVDYNSALVFTSIDSIDVVIRQLNDLKSDMLRLREQAEKNNEDNKGENG